MRSRWRCQEPRGRKAPLGLPGKPLTGSPRARHVPLRKGPRLQAAAAPGASLLGAAPSREAEPGARQGCAGWGPPRPALPCRADPGRGEAISPPRSQALPRYAALGQGSNSALDIALGCSEGPSRGDPGGAAGARVSLWAPGPWESTRHFALIPSPGCLGRQGGRGPACAAGPGAPTEAAMGACPGGSGSIEAGRGWKPLGSWSCGAERGEPSGPGGRGCLRAGVAPVADREVAHALPGLGRGAVGAASAIVPALAGSRGRHPLQRGSCPRPRESGSRSWCWVGLPAPGPLG